jgi:hypothetical protein
MGKLYPVVDREAVRTILWNHLGGDDRYIAINTALDAIMALPPVKQSDGLAERVREAEIADRAYARLEGHFRSLAHIASHTLDCNADDVRKLEDSAEFVARYRKEQRDVHG